MITRESLCTQLETYYPRLQNETAQYQAKRVFAEKCIKQLRSRSTMDRLDFWLCLWLALPHDNAFIRHMPLREQLR